LNHNCRLETKELFGAVGRSGFFADTWRVPFDVHYHCQRCTACCRWPGQVKVSEFEIASIAAFLGLEEHDFIQKFTRLRQQRDGLALIDKGNGECFFLEGSNCVINDVKPRQCRDFPNKWNFPGWRQVCEAVPELMRD
jgi:Fe-S-cluster containining protein